jgi:predicted nucleic acid-binding protein
MKDFNIQPDSTYFVDTNIWLYSFIQSQKREKTEISRAIIDVFVKSLSFPRRRESMEG